MDLIIRNVRLASRPDDTVDIGVARGRIAAMEHDLSAETKVRLLNLKNYGIAVGNPADVVIINARTPEQAVAEIAQPVAAFKNGKQTVEWNPPELIRPR